MPGTSTAPVTTDHGRDLDRLTAEIAERAAPPGPRNAEQATRLASCRVNRAALSGDVGELRLAAAAVDEALQRFGGWPDLCYLRASVHLKQHELREATASLAAGPGLADAPDGRAIQADVDLQLGRYEEARRAYERLAAGTGSWDMVARLAHFEAVLGDPGRADELYARAADEITAKELRSYAWVETERARLHLRHGRLADAERHSERAGAAYSGHWVVERRLAEVYAAQGRLDEAIAVTKACAARTGRPELAQAAGDLLVRAGAGPEARAWHARALHGYLESADLGEVQYLHHLGEHLGRVEGEGTTAVLWAERDHALRPHFATEAALAWALHLDGRSERAAALAERVLHSGAADPVLVARMEAIRHDTSDGGHRCAVSP
jgi:tetratricopeptide (TPR) repeat protein